jgi:hypothetical protein
MPDLVRDGKTLLNRGFAHRAGVLPSPLVRKAPASCQLSRQGWLELGRGGHDSAGAAGRTCSVSELKVARGERQMPEKTTGSRPGFAESAPPRKPRTAT